MATNPNQLTVIGNVTADPELRQTEGGVPVVNFTIASTPRIFDREANEWRDGDTLFVRCEAWRDEAQNIAASLNRGSRVIATGSLKPNSYEKDGVTHNEARLVVEEIGASLKYATVQISKVKNSSTSRPAGQAGEPAPASSDPASAAGADDDF